MIPLNARSVMKRWIGLTLAGCFLGAGMAPAEAQTGSRSVRGKKSTTSENSRQVKIEPGDWNQFRGPNRDNLSPETGLADKWPEGGPELLQTISGIGEGYASVSLVGDLMYTMGNVDGGEQVIALDRSTGKIVWKTRNGDEYTEGQGNGPRGTPTVIDGKVYSPGGKDATVVALDAMTGKVIWKSQVPEQPAASYASPVVATIGKVKQYVIFTSKGICGVRASDGEPLWGQNASSNGTANCATPLVVDNYVFSSSDYGTGAELVELKAQGKSIEAKQVYFTKDMKNHHGGMVFLDGYVYGSNGDMLSCVGANAA